QVEVLAVGLARPCVRGGDARGEEFARGERQLVALLRLALQERPRAVHLCAAAPGAAELPVDEHGNAAITARGRELVGRDQRIDGGDDERRFRRGERHERLRLVGGRRGRRRRFCLLCLGRLGLRQAGGDRGAGKPGAEQEFATRFIRHGSLPLFVLWKET